MQGDSQKTIKNKKGSIHQSPFSSPMSSMASRTLPGKMSAQNLSGTLNNIAINENSGL